MTSVITKTDIYMGGVSLAQLDRRIIVQSITENAAETDHHVTKLAGHIGSRYTSTDRASLSVEVAFSIAGHHDLAGRAEVLQKVAAWALSSDTLTVSYRVGQMLEVVCTELPALGDVKRWTEDLRMVFTAYAVPYWVDIEPYERQSTASKYTTTFNGIPNNSPLKPTIDLYADVTTEGKIMTAFRVESGSQVMRFTDLSIVAGDKIYVNHERGLIKAYVEHADGTVESILGKRTADSSDDIYLAIGNNIVTINATGLGAVWKLSFRGRYL